MLTYAALCMLADRPGVKRSAVINFLSTLSSKSSQEEAFANLALDARLYGWNEPTQQVIREGIRAHLKEP